MTGRTRSRHSSGGLSFSQLFDRHPAAKGAKKRRRPPTARKFLWVQPLEQRVLLSAVSWIGGSGDWDVGGNWSGGSVPGSGDTVSISTGSAATITIKSGDGINIQSLTTGANDTLSIIGGSLTVTSGTSTLSGPLDMTGGSLEATGNTASLTANGATTVSQANLYAENGGTLSLPQLTSSVSNGTFEANGAGSVLDVSALATLTQIGGWGVNAYSGGEVKLSGLTSLTSTHGITINDTGGSTLLDAKLTTLDGVSVTLDGTDLHVADLWTKFTNGSLQVNGDASGLGYSLSGLTDVDGSNLYAESGGQLALPNLTSYVSNGTFEANGANSATSAPSTLDVSALTTVTQTGGWTLNAYNGGKFNLSGLTSLTSTQGISVHDTGGATLQDPKLTTLNGVAVKLDGTDPHVADSWTKFTTGSLEVDGNASGLGYSLSGLTDVDGSSLYAESGGQLTLPNLTSYVASGTFEANGTNTATTTPSLLDVSALTTVTQTGGWTLNAYNGGKFNLSGLTSLTSTQGISVHDTGGATLQDPKLTTLNGVAVKLDGTDPHVADSWTKFTQGSLEVDGDASGLGYSLSGLTDVDGSSLYAESGGQLTLPNLTSYVSSGTFEANGTNTATTTPSLLDVSALTTVTQTGGWTLNAYNGGKFDLSGLTILASTQGISIHDTGGATLLDPKLTTLSGVGVTLDGTDPHVADSWTQFTKGSLEVDGNASGTGYSLSALTDVDGSSLYAEKGGQLTLPDLTSYASSGTFEANGSNSATSTPSMLDLSALTAVTQTGGWTLNAYSGGTLKLSGLTSLTSTQGITIHDTGGSSLLDGKLATLTGVDVNTDGSDPGLVSAWTTFTGGSLTITSGTLTFPKLTDAQLTAGSGATLVLPVLTTGDVTIANGASAEIQGTAVSLPADGTSGATINVPQTTGLTITLKNTGTLTGTTFDVGQGSNVVLYGGTYLGTTTFQVGSGASVDLTGGQTTNYGGTLTGSGTGTVQFTSGDFSPAVGGVTLNFPGNVFQWTGGAFFASLGDVTNKGTMNLSGSNDKGVYEDATLDNFGTIIQTGSGNLGLHSDNVSPTMLKIEPGATYKIESDSGIDNPYGGQTAVDNEGTIVKTAGSGTSTLTIPGPLTNTGTVEADSGTLDLEPTSFAQISSGTLTGGTWNALNGATIKFPTGTSITSNAANITLDGSGAAMPALALASNSGTLALTNGASLSTPGNFSNSGNLTLGGALSVGGNFTQTSAGTLDEQIGGSPASGNFGQIVATGSATLAGAFQLSLVNSFTPVDGQVFPVLKYASASGSFSPISGLPSRMTVNPTATVLDLDMPAAGADLGLAGATAPTTATAGQSITVAWQVKDDNGVAATGSWQDSVYLSSTQSVTSSSVLLGSVEHSGGLAANGSYNGTLSAAVPALPPGKYYVLVVVDSLYQVSDPDRSNNTLAATTGQLTVSVPALTLGTAASGSFAAADQDQYYQVTVPAGGSLVVALTSSANSGATALYVSQGAEPTAYDYQEASAVDDQPNQTVTVPNSAGGTYYILVHSVSGAAATAGYSLEVTQTSALSISAISPGSGGNGGNVTIEIDGANFTATSTASLTLGNATIDASAIDFVNSSQLFATFNLTGAAIGAYTLIVNQGATSATATTTFQVVAANAVPFSFDLQTPAAIRAGRTAPIVITYTNESNDDISVRELTISSTNADASFSSTGVSGTFTSTLQVAASPASGPASVLRPGEHGYLYVYLLSDDTANDDEIDVDVDDDEDDEDEDDDVDNEVSHDPNAMVGPSGYGTQEFIKPQGPLPYTVDFENDGGVAAQDVTVTQQLASNLDWSTLQLGSFGFGTMNVSVPAGLTQYQTTVSYQNQDGSALNVQVAIDFNVQTGLLTATFTSLDPTTGQAPTGVTDGFLPPDNASGIGEGYIEYTVQPKSGLTTGNTLNAAASVVFDTNAPVVTKTFTNTIDTGAELTSSVTALPAAESSDTFSVSWSGSDTGGSGIAGYDVFVSDNGGAYTAFQTDTTATSATFTGVDGHTYAFYSVATDNVGNVQPTPTAAQATTTVNPVPFSVTEHTYVIGSGTITVSAANGLLANDTGPSQLTVTAGTVTGAQGGTFTVNADGSFTYTPGASFPGYDSAQVTVTDASGDTGTETVNVLSQHAAVVWKFYESVLNREPDPSGLQYWTNYFNNGGQTGQMAVGFFESTELLDKIITKYYQQYLLRAPDAAGLAYWVSQWQATGEPEGIKAGFADSPEFYNSAGGTPQSWLTALYERILGRAPDPQGQAYWLNYYQQQTAAGVDAGTVQQQIALGFFDSAEAYGDDVTGWFSEYLGRTPTAAELALYQGQMESGATDRTIEQEITNLPEYASEPPAPAAGAAAALADYYQASAQSQAVVAAKDVVFASL